MTCYTDFSLKNTVSELENHPLKLFSIEISKDIAVPLRKKNILNFSIKDKNIPIITPGQFSVGTTKSTFGIISCYSLKLFLRII